MARLANEYSRLRSLKDSIAQPFGRQTNHGLFKLDRRIFVDQDIFELEIKYIFEKGWVYLCHESQVADPNDFFSTHLGRQPVVVTRDGDGVISCFVNACSHRGATFCRHKKGNRKGFTCPFHGWVYDNKGRLLHAGEQDGVYPAAFDKAALSAPQVRTESYRGFIFGSLDKDVEPLRTYLGPATRCIDNIVDQSVTGDCEVVRGSSTYFYDGNWKLAAENGVDGYHALFVHRSYLEAAQKASKAVIDFSRAGNIEGGYFYYGNGHATMWAGYPNPADRPNHSNRAYYLERFGPQKTKWMIDRCGNSLLFPNMLLLDTASIQIRVIRPIGLKRTEVTTYCLAPVGENAEVREHRLRQYEDFFNATGLATPDDLAVFDACQRGFEGRAVKASDISRGAPQRSGSPADWTWSEGVTAAQHAGSDSSNEGIYVGIYEGWRERMIRGIESELEGGHVG